MFQCGTSADPSDTLCHFVRQSSQGLRRLTVLAVIIFGITAKRYPYKMKWYCYKYCSDTSAADEPCYQLVKVHGNTVPDSVGSFVGIASSGAKSASKIMATCVQYLFDDIAAAYANANSSNPVIDRKPLM